MDRYFAKPYGRGMEVEGRSQVVTHDVEDTINWSMPHLMRTFAPSDDLITCESDLVDDNDDSLKTTAQYLRHLFFKKLGGEHALYDFIFDGLLQKVGILRTGWEHPRPSPPKVLEGLTAEQVQRYVNDPDYQILESEMTEDVIEGEAQPATLPREDTPPAAALGLMAPNGPQLPAMLQPQGPDVGPTGPIPVMTFSLKVQKVPRVGKPIVECIPPELFRITSQSKSIEEASYHGAKFQVFIADLVSDYPEKRYELDPEGRFGRSDDDVEMASDARTQSRFPDEPDSGQSSLDDKYRETGWQSIEYIRIDYDQDGIVELRRIVRLGDIILENEIADESEFTLWSPIRVSHRALGRSVADTLLDIQKIRTVLARAELDGLSQHLRPRQFVNQRAIGKDPTILNRMLDHDVGDVIPVDGNPNEVVMVQTMPDVSGAARTSMEYWDRFSEKASGVTTASQGVRPGEQHDTMGGIDKLQSAANVRIELIARHAATSLEVALGKLLRLVVKHRHTPEIFKVEGKRVQWDPRRVTDDMTVSIHVGMTAESREKKLVYLSTILGVQEKIIVQAGIGNPLVSLKHIGHTVGQMIQVMGYKNTGQFISEVPENWQPPEPGMDPKLAEVQGKQQLAQAEFQSKAQLQQAELQHKTEMERIGFQLKSQFEAQEAERAARLKEAEFARNAEVEQLKIDGERQRKDMELAHNAEMARLNADLEREKAAAKAELEREIAAEKLAQEERIATMRLEAEQATAAARLNAEMELARWKAGSEVKMARWKADQDAKVNRFKARASAGDKVGKGNGSAKPPATPSTDDDGITTGVRFGGNIG